MWKNLFDGPHLLVIVIVLIVLFGWKKLPDIARSLGRSARILRSEADEFKAERKGQTSSAAGQTVQGEKASTDQQGGVRDTFQQGMDSFKDGLRGDEPQQQQYQPQEGHPQGYPRNPEQH